MIRLFAAFALLISTTAHAQNSNEEYFNYVITVDWSDPRSLEDSMVQQCDDSYYPAVEIVVPGKAGEDFWVEMDADITNGTPRLGCSIKKSEKDGKTTYTLEAISSGCEVKFQKRGRDYRDQKTKAIYNIGDAC